MQKMIDIVRTVVKLNMFSSLTIDEVVCNASHLCSEQITSEVVLDLLKHYLTQYVELFEDLKGVVRVRLITDHPQDNNPEEEVQVMAYK